MKYVPGLMMFAIGLLPLMSGHIIGFAIGLAFIGGGLSYMGAALEASEPELKEAQPEPEVIREADFVGRTGTEVSIRSNRRSGYTTEELENMRMEIDKHIARQKKSKSRDLSL